MQSIHGGPQRLVAGMTVGEGQQTWIGPAFANGELFFCRSCPFACPRADGAYRYDPKAKTYAHAPSSYTVSGFAIDESGRRAFEVLGLFADRAEFGDVVTSLILTRVLSFTPRRPPIVKGS